MASNDAYTPEPEYESASGSVAGAAGNALGEFISSYRSAVANSKSMQLYASRPKGKAGSAVSTVVGSITMFWAVIFGMSALACLPNLLGTAICGAITYVLGKFGLKKLNEGTQRRAYLNRYTIYVNYIKSRNRKDYVSIKDLGTQTGLSKAKCAKELQQMVNDGLFLQGHVESAKDLFFISDKAYWLYQIALSEVSEKQKKEAFAAAAATEKSGSTAAAKSVPAAKAAPQKDDGLTPEARAIISKGRHYVQVIKSANDALPGAEISAKLDTLEDMVSRICDAVQKHPDYASDLTMMMDFYLPTTEKLLDRYRELDSLPDPGDNVNSTKDEIESSLDVMNIAFKKKLDDLYMSQNWDVSSDISVLKTMLAREGLIDDVNTLDNRTTIG